jgi:hypothetical protein
MPNFYPRADAQRQLPLTPPEFFPSYKGGMQYQSSYPRQGIVHHEDNGYKYAERRYEHTSTLGSAPPPPPMIYPQHSTYPNSGIMPQVPSYYEPMNAPLLPPMRTVHERASVQSMHRPSQEQLARAQQPKEEKPTGGVSQNLDYSVETMTDFVTEMSQGLYDLLLSPFCLADIDMIASIQPGKPATATYRKWVNGVLSATRLPSVTILLGLHYLSLRVSMLSQSGQFRHSDANLTRMVTLGLLLGSKFLDDNTFINRSWSEVSGISVLDLNKLEIEWLSAFDFRLHRDPSEKEGFGSWLDAWKDYEINAASRTTKRTELAPIDTNLHHLSAGSKSYSAVPYGFGRLPTPEYTHKPQSQYNSAAPYSGHFDPWNASAASEPSPPTSAPITGPTTPEYYGSTNIWAPSEGYSRRTMFGFPPVTQPPIQPMQQAPPQVGYNQSCYTQQFSPWNTHGAHCNCYNCARQRPSYFLPSGFGQQAVAS